MRRITARIDRQVTRAFSLRTTNQRVAIMRKMIPQPANISRASSGMQNARELELAGVGTAVTSICTVTD
jgi:hypothetical protein